MSWAGHVTYTEEMRNTTKFWSEDLKGEDHLKDLVVGERVILKWILEK
jgi:hypothetical protein